MDVLKIWNNVYKEIYLNMQSDYTNLDISTVL